jgi:hypothetical protein
VNAYIKKAPNRQAEEECDQDFDRMDRHLSPSDTIQDPERPVLVKLPHRKMVVGSNDAFPSCALKDVRQRVSLFDTILSTKMLLLYSPLSQTKRRKIDKRDAFG